MSHFSVAVITEGKPTREDLEKILAPYDEELEVITYKSKADAIAKVRADIAAYARDTYADYLKDKEEYKKRGASPEHIKYLEEEFPKKLGWTDEECYQDAIKYEEKEDIMEDGSIRSRYNPDAKWDWWSFGGRWCGKLFVDESCMDCERGEKSWIDQEGDPYKCEYKGLKRVDMARIKDLKFPETEKLSKEAERFWELYIEKKEPETDEDKELIKFVFYREQYYIDKYQTKENYIRATSTFATYAAVTKDDKWHEQGSMGWFGMSTGDDPVTWTDGYKSLIFDNATESDYITIIDCHI